MMNFSKIILASASPRRKELLAQVGFEFDIIAAKGEEVVTSDIPNQVVMELSAQKAKEVAANAPENALVIGADTVVALGNKIEFFLAQKYGRFSCGIKHGVRNFLPTAQAVSFV